MDAAVAEKLAQRLGTSVEEVQATAKNAVANNGSAKASPVGRSPDFHRVSTLPMRPWNKYHADDYIDVVTESLKTFRGTMRLRPVQAAALIEAQRARGLVGLIGVGQGKALISFLLPVVLDAKCTVLMVPPALVSQTHREFERMKIHWKLPDKSTFHVVAYTALQGKKDADILNRLKPDCIIFDEASALKNKATKRGRIISQFMSEFAPMCCILSGTLTTKSLKDYAHLCHWALRDGSPLPIHWPTLNEWCMALDSNIPDYARKQGGVLWKFCETKEEPVREGFRRRLISTPGVSATDSSAIGTSLVYSKRELTMPKEVQDAIDVLNRDWKRPDGEEFSDVLTLAKSVREVGCGFWLKWMWPDDEPDFEWLEARKNWNQAVRERLRHPAPGRNSPLECFNEAARGKWQTEAFAPWVEVKGRKPPPTEAQWISDFMVDDAIAWGKESPGIIWYNHVAMGERIASKGGFPLYGPGDKKCKAPARCDCVACRIGAETGNRTIVVSVHAHSDGKNLQAFSRNLVTLPPSSGKLWEQMVARTHRPGQEADEVSVDVYLHTPTFEGAVRDAIGDAAYMHQTTGNPQKLLYGVKTFDGFDDVAPKQVADSE